MAETPVFLNRRGTESILSFRLPGPATADLGGGGERFVPQGRLDDGAIEHLHRYLACCELVRGKMVLDVACGEGYGASLLGQAGAAEVLGLDISTPAIAHAARTHSDWAKYAVADACSLPLQDASVDVVVSFETIEHLNEPRRFVQEVNRVLKLHGMLLCSTPNRDVYAEARGGVANPFHLDEMNIDEFRSLLLESFDRVALFGQEILYGSQVWPMEGGEGSTRVSFRADPSLSSFREVKGRAPTYVIAVAMKGTGGDLPAPSTLTIDILRNPVSALLGGIAERDAEISRLRAQLAKHRKPA